MSDFDTDVDKLIALADEQFPEPVDELEDELAAQLGFHRGPGCSVEEWRKMRVRLIEEARQRRRREGLGCPPSL